MRRLVCIVALLLVSLCFGDTFKVDISIGGKSIGTENWDIHADGTFECKSNWDLPGQKADSHLTGKLEKEKLTSFKMDLTMNSEPIKLEWDGAKFKASVGGKAQPERDLKSTGAAFSNFHIQLLRTLLAQYDAAVGGRQPIDALIIEGGSAAKTFVTRTGSSQVTIGGKSVPITRWVVEVGLAQMQIVQGEDGKILGAYVPSQQFKAIVEGYGEVFVDPTTKHPEISQPSLKTKVDKGVKTPMRDGVNLVADIVRPDADGRFPVVLSRTPYGRAGGAFLGDWWAKRGYVFVSQDCRGRGDSDGDWLPFENERKDGFDTVGWIAKQPWCDGNVGMIGGSYGGLVQWAAAVEHPKALKCIIPQVSPPTAFFNVPWDHGVFFLYGNTWWSGIVRDKQSQFSGLGVPNTAALATLPLEKVDDGVWGKSIPFFDSWLKRETPAQYPGYDYQKEVEKVRIPVLMISGWYDGDGIGTKMNWESQRIGGNPNRWLIYGPWTHIFNSSTSIGDTNFGPDAVIDLDTVYLRFFDTYLKSKKAGLDTLSRVQAFVTGENKWRNLDEWPSTKSVKRAMYFGAKTPANGGASGGTLLDKPLETSKPSQYTYSPAKAEIPSSLSDPDPNKASFAIDLTKLGNDSLFFKSDQLKKSLTIEGPITVDLYFSTTVKDTDFFANLVDIDEKGIGHHICTGGKIRAKYVSGWNTPKLLTAGKIYKAAIEIWDVAHRFEKGHRLGVVIQSSGFPLYARNLNTGEPVYGATRMVTANQTIYHDAKHPSCFRFRELP